MCRGAVDPGSRELLLAMYMTLDGDGKMDEAFIAEISSNIVKDFVKDIVSGSYAGLDSLLKKISLNFRREFPEYEKKRCRELSSIPSLYKLGGYIQVTQNFCEMLIERDGGELFNQDFLFNQCLNGGSFAVEAQAGYGKSFLLRWLYLNICHSNVRKIPIFIELRDINNLPYIDIYDYLANEVSVNDKVEVETCLLYTSPSPRDQRGSRMPSSA